MDRFPPSVYEISRILLSVSDAIDEFDTGNPGKRTRKAVDAASALVEALATAREQNAGKLSPRILATEELLTELDDAQIITLLGGFSNMRADLHTLLCAVEFDAAIDETTLSASLGELAISYGDAAEILIHRVALRRRIEHDQRNG